MFTYISHFVVSYLTYNLNLIYTENFTKGDFSVHCSHFKMSAL